MARKSRQNRYFPEKTESKWKAGVYARLSVSDNRVYGESLIYQLKLAQEALLSKSVRFRHFIYVNLGILVELCKNLLFVYFWDKNAIFLQISFVPYLTSA